MNQLFRIGCIATSLLLIPTGYGASDAQVFKSTIKQVDTEGQMLTFCNTKRVTKFVESIPDLVTQCLDPEGKDPKVKLGVTISKALLKALSLNRIQGYATSSRQLDRDLFILKNFSYFEQIPGIYQLWGAKNQPFKTLYSLPEDTRIALSLDLAPKKFWSILIEEANKTNDPQISGSIATIQGLFEMSTQVRLEDLLASLEGKWEFLAYGMPDNYGIKLTIPDKKNLLGKILRAQLQLAPEANSFVIPWSYGKMINPVVYFENGSIIAVSQSKVIDRLKSVKGKGLLSTVEFAKLNKNLPAEGLDYFVVNFDTNLRNALINMAPKDFAPRLRNIFKDNTLSILSVDRWEDNGVKCIAASNVALPEIAMIAGPAISSISQFLPALTKARAKTKSISSLNNLKQIGVALNMYALDNQNSLPSSLNDLGKYISNKSVFKCPMTQKNYIYIANQKIDKKQPLSKIPVAFSAPTGKDIVPVLFLDGHVEIVKLGVPYIDKNQVVDVLGKRYKFSATTIEKMKKSMVKING